MSLVETVKNAGIVGAGGAGFPTHVKLNAKSEYFIVNAAECEPLIETDKFLIRTRAADLVKGVDMIAKELGADKKYIALKAAYKTEIAALEKAIAEAGSDIKLHKMGYFYPAGDEQVIVCEITGKSVPERGIPLMVGAVVDNVGTVLNIVDAYDGKPVTDKFLSVVGEVKHPVMLHVPLGTSVRECVKAADPTISNYAVIMGGPMMGKVHDNDEDIDKLVITKTDGNIIVLPKDHYLITSSHLKPESMINRAKSSCIQCRMCTDNCPRYQTGHDIKPHMTMRNLYRESMITDNDEYLRVFGHVMNCSECGACELFSCPMHLSPRKANVYIKNQLRARGIDVPKNPAPEARPEREVRKIPTNRLVARLGLSKYYGKHLATDEPIILNPEVVEVPLKQHIGAPATAVVSVGDAVKKGDPIGVMDEGKLGANVYASFDGEVTAVTDRVEIRRESK